MRIREIVHARPLFGYTRIHVMLRRKGWLMNKKRVHHLYRLEDLQLHMRVRRRKHTCLDRDTAPVPAAPHERYSMAFVRDQLYDGRAFRVLTAVNQLSRESPLLEADFAMSGWKVTTALDNRSDDIPLPASHGTQFTSKALEESAWRRDIKLDFIRPGTPIESGHIVLCNSRMRDKCLNDMQFMSIEEARSQIEA